MKSFYQKFFVLILFTFLGQLIWNKVSPYKDYPYARDKVQSLEEAKGQKFDIAYFGDSTNSWGTEGDLTTMISSLIGQYLGHSSVLLLSRPGDHMQDFKSSFIAMDKLNIKTDTVIIVINLRSFAPEWNYQYYYEHKWDQFLLENIKWRPIIDLFIPFITGFTDLNKPSLRKEEFEKIPIFYDSQQVSSAQECTALNTNRQEVQTREKIRLSLICNYGQQVRAQHRRFINLQSLVHFAKRKNINIFFYFTPINYSLIKKYQLTETLRTLQNNKGIITNFLQRENIPFADFSSIFPSHYFGWGKGIYPNEHLYLVGRQELAKRIVHAIKRPMP